jgi:hypothetical protein
MLLSLVFLFFFLQIELITVVKLLLAPPARPSTTSMGEKDQATSVVSAPPTIPDRLIRMSIMPHKIRTHGIVLAISQMGGSKYTPWAGVRMGHALALRGDKARP